MRYISTRGQAPSLSFEEAMLTGLARDGGLYVQENWPQMNHDDITNLAGLSNEEVAIREIKPFIGNTFSDVEFRDGEIVCPHTVVAVEAACGIHIIIREGISQ